MKEKEQEIEVHDRICTALAETIKSAITEFPPEAGQEDEDSTNKVERLA